MEFVKFKRAVHAQFNQLAAGADMLFLTNVDKDALWDCYLNSFPEEERQSHNCNNCKHYIRHYGRVVAIKDNKVVTMWENLQLDEPYATVARNLDALVKSKPVVDVFITRDYELGIDRNNAYVDSLQGPKVITWNHLYYHMPNQLVYTGTESVSAVMGTLRTTKEVFKRALEELTIDSIETVLDLIGQNALYRGEQFKNDLSVFLGHKRHYDSLPDEEKDNWCWANFNRVGCARIRNTAIGTLLVNISSGLELDDCVTAYEYIESHNHIVVGPDIEGTLRLSSIVNKNPGLPADVKGFSYSNIVSFDAVKIGRNELFVACPPGQLNNPEVTITKKAVDPIVYQPCAYGVLIHSMWGEESEDKVFEEYKRINNLML